MKRSEELMLERECLVDFFKYQIKQTKSCENCGEYIYKPSTINQAHILNKSRFKSVMCEEDNCLHLCKSCHHEYDSSWRRAMSMKVWELAVERFKKFEYKILEKSLILLKFKQWKK